jgi:D-alanyl-D-alanine carboxypeptidase
MYPNNRYKQLKPKRLASPKGLFLALLVFALVVAGVGGILLIQNKQDDKSGRNTPAAQVPSFDKKKYSLSDPTSPWVIVNKQRPLDPKTYEPSTLRTPNMEVESSDMKVNDETATALEALALAAANEGIHLLVASAYRSHADQTTIYNSMVRGYGQEEADRQSARPGYSEHQTGWAADLGAANGNCRIDTCFADTKEGKWLAANAYKYGFIIRYTEDKENVTGYHYEPWHVRYVGVELSTEMHNKSIQTLEEFFGLSAARDYQFT